MVRLKKKRDLPSSSPLCPFLRRLPGIHLQVFRWCCFAVCSFKVMLYVKNFPDGWKECISKFAWTEKKNNSKREIEKIDRNGIPLQLPKRPWLNFQMSHISFGRHQMCLKYVEENPKVFKSFFFFSLTRSVWVRSGGGWDNREKRTASEAQSSLQIASLPVLIQFRGIERTNTTAADWNAGGSSYSQKKKTFKNPNSRKKLMSKKLWLK